MTTPTPPSPEAIAAAVARAVPPGPQFGEGTPLIEPPVTEAKKHNKGAVKPGVSKTTGKADGRLKAGGTSRNRGKPR